MKTLFDSLTCDISDPIVKKSKSNKKKLAGILIGSSVFLVGMLIVGFVLNTRKRKLRNQGEFFTHGL